MVNTLNGNIVNLMNRFAPLKSRRVGYSPKHWFNNDIKQAMDERKAVYDNLKVNDPVTHQQRNELYKLKSLIRSAKKESTVNDSKEATTMRSIWNIIESLGCCKEAKSKNSNSKILDNFNLNDINKSFVSIHESDGADLNDLSLPDNIQSTFRFQQINIDIFMAAFRQIKSNAIGHDEIPLKFLKLIILSIAQHIVTIFNYCISNR